MAQNLAAFQLDERQQRFVHEIVKGVSTTASAELAGYDSQSSYQLLRNPAIAAAIDHEMRRVLLTRDAPAARLTLRNLMDDERSGARVRVDAAKILLQIAGFTPPVQEKGAGAERSLADMSATELKEFIGKHEGEIGKIEGELAARATPVNAPGNAPNEGRILTEGADFLD